MAKARELPSGAWRVEVFVQRDASGKRIRKSFTAPSPQEAEYAALEWKLGKTKEAPEDITVNNAVSRYIDAKRGVLSPSTIRIYEGALRNYFSGVFGNVKLDKLTSTITQIWISDLSKKLSPKTVRNTYALLTATLEMFAPDLRIKATLPARKKPELYTPSDEDIKKLLAHIKGKELELAVLLAAFGPMRRGEICALTSDDINGNIVNVNKSMVQGPDGLWHIKQPKTYGSYRKIEYPDFVINKLKNIDGRIFNATPEHITSRFCRAIRFAKLPHFRFHDLRHYSASIMHAIGVPDQYIMQRGGWQSDNIMKSVYRNVINEETVKQNSKIMDHFNDFQDYSPHESPHIAGLPK
jgi:integrase